MGAKQTRDLILSRDLVGREVCSHNQEVLGEIENVLVHEIAVEARNGMRVRISKSNIVRYSLNEPVVMLFMDEEEFNRRLAEANPEPFTRR